MSTSKPGDLDADGADDDALDPVAWPPARIRSAAVIFQMNAISA
jgi:hypothetical protein